MIEKVPVVVDPPALMSRKLIGAIAAMINVNALIISLAAIRPELFASQPVLIGAAVTGMLGLGGWQILQQAKADMTNGSNGG